MRHPLRNATLDAQIVQAENWLEALKNLRAIDPDDCVSKEAVDNLAEAVGRVGELVDDGLFIPPDPVIPLEEAHFQRVVSGARYVLGDKETYFVRLKGSLDLESYFAYGGTYRECLDWLAGEDDWAAARAAWKA